MEPATKAVKRTRVRTAPQLERKRLLDRLSQHSRRQRKARDIEALHEENRGLRSEIACLISAGLARGPLSDYTQVGARRVCKLVSCCHEVQEHTAKLGCFQKIMFDTLMQSRLHTPPSLPRDPAIEDVLLLREPGNPAAGILFRVLRRPGLQDPILRSAWYLLGWRVLRYRLSPSPETYDDVPPWLRTTQVEDSTPHPIYMDFMIFPRLRQALALKEIDIDGNLEQFEADFGMHISLYWPLSGSLTVIDDAHNTTLNPEFERCVFTLQNWSLDASFARKYPHIAPLVNINS